MQAFSSICFPSHRIPSLATEVGYLVGIDFQVSEYLNQYWLHDVATLKITAKYKQLEFKIAIRSFPPQYLI